MPREKLSVDIYSYAKINLFLNIEGTRDDGYHLLSMVNAKISVYDVVTCSLTYKPKIELTCSDPTLPTDIKNMAFQAAARFREQSHLAQGVIIHIEKDIPVGAGLAGGSSNAAAVLYALQQMTYHRIPKSALLEIAKGIGADVPFFLEPGICVCSGIGERIVPIHVTPRTEDSKIYGVLCSPEESVSTPVAYRLWDQWEKPKQISPRDLINALTQHQWDTIPEYMFNAFEPVIFEQYPIIKKAYRIFRSVSPTVPRLTGSGSNLFSIHSTKTEALAVAEILRDNDLIAFIFHVVL